MKRKVIMASGQAIATEGQQTASVYCNADGSVSVWVVIDSVDYLAFTATLTDLMQVPAQPPQDILIKSGQGIALYRLSTGELQFQSANGYVFRWCGCLAA